MNSYGRKGKQGQEIDSLRQRRIHRANSIKTVSLVNGQQSERRKHGSTAVLMGDAELLKLAGDQHNRNRHAAKCKSFVKRLR